MRRRTKKVCLWSTALVVVAVCVVTWACLPEYGEGYSEDQRRNWNLLIAASEDDPTYYYESALSDVLLARQSLADAPEWKIDFSSIPSDLPLEGMLISSLKRLADQGDGDACLELAFRPFDSGSDSVNDLIIFDFPSWNAVYQAEKYLKKAVETGRPGADFLFRLLERRKKPGMGCDVKSVEGYFSFLPFLDQGDFALGKMYLYLAPQDDEGLNRLAIGLKRRIEEGDKDALRNSAHLNLLRKLRGTWSSWTQCFFDLQTRDAYEQGDKIADSVCWILPEKIYGNVRDQVREWVVRHFQSSLWKSSRQSLIEPLKVLVQCAEAGDIHAKWLWCFYRVHSQLRFSRDDWEKHLKYADDLLRSKGIYGKNEYNHYFVVIEDSFFYQEKSVREMIRLTDARGKKDNCLSQLNMESENDMGYFSLDFTREIFGIDERWSERMLTPEEKRHALKLIEEGAQEGDPYAWFYLAVLLDDGRASGADVHRAWELLESLQIWCWGIDLEGRLKYDFVYLFKEKDGKLIEKSASIDKAIQLKMLDMVSRHGDMPGMTVREGFERLLGLPDEGFFGYNEYQEKLAAQFEKRGFKVPDEKK